MTALPVSAGGGPSGAAPSPPPWLGTASLPLISIPQGQSLHRIHRTSLDPVFFGPGKANPPTFRFDSASGRFGVLYVGAGQAGAMAETLLRNPQRLMVAMKDIEERALSVIACRRSLKLVQLHGAGLQQVGTDNAVSTGPYGPCGLWTDALWDHADKPDGIAYQSRHDSSEICFALFERPDIAFDVRTTMPLPAMLKDVALLLDRYGKSLSPR